MFTELATELAIEADVHFCIGKLRHISQMATERKPEIDLRTNTFDQLV